ncbi:hypothetical protein UREG_00412 [Uncinocarpus reesii 1704]|uniref:Phosphatidylinositol N-acetylglucosaminyltransferase subunit C n=1 Tax=Uncinocarpus reesii (strain UAMH 1704) TaxID=336963 RepID=C4JDY8_UNCRE|nr:uncharacterized protein UREG_00412 [Uncinocarpus reesii 1704]EEP75566.1 hypothetical protein UREG_00412 [Uncinocarpus reesii 1704]
MASPPPTPNNTSRPQSSGAPTAPIPPPVPVETHPNRAGLKPRPPLRPPPDPNRLAPEDAYFAHSPPRLRPLNVPNNHPTTNPDLLNRVIATPAAVAALRPPPAVPGTEPKVVRELRRDRGRSRRRKRQWKKLLWVKQSFPDNYTDTETFLDHLQRNPRLRPYDFWPLVADFTVIVQHVCSVIIFLCCFVAIFQERVSPVSVVTWATLCTIFCWGLWNYWEGKVQMEAVRFAHAAVSDSVDDGSSSISSTGEDSKRKSIDHGLGLSLGLSSIGCPLSRQSSMSSAISDNTSATSLHSARSPASPWSPSISNSNGFVKFSDVISQSGLSPILQSLTKSTTSDSIWANVLWLMANQHLLFDYSSGCEENQHISNNTAAGAGAVAAKFPASLSTNAALMASTVLASRLKSTTHVFSLTLFSIEVFGLFPIFRRHLRAISWRGHVILTMFLVISASAGVGVTLKGGYKGPILGIFIGAPSTALAMGGCSWWLIRLQKYKNVVAGPWDQAKPILRRQWD